MKALTEKMPDAKIHDGVRLLIAPFYANLEVKRSMNADLTDGRCRVVGTRQLLKKLASDEISVLYVAKDAQREITEKLTALAEGNRVEIVTVETMEKLGDMCGIAVGSAAVSAMAGRQEASIAISSIRLRYLRSMDTPRQW